MQLDTLILIISFKMKTKTFKIPLKYKINFVNT